MRPLVLYSEPFPPGGSIDARTVKRALGRSTYDPWSVFLRETLQNSWDARSEPDGPISFGVDAWFATEDQLGVLRETIFAALPSGSALGVDLEDGALPVLVVSDWGTRGLGGPTRADRATSERTDFIDFVRNIGRDQKKGFAGGTYGLGKGVLFQHSVHDTILVFTRTTFMDRPISRFMGLAVSEPYEDDRLRFTGRHWWGIEDEATGVNPVQGRPAEELALALGMDSIPEGETGTAIMVIAPAALDEGDWEGRDSIDDIVGRIVDAAAWHAWPHMSGSIRTPSIQFFFSCEGSRITPPDPSHHPVLKHYVGAYRRAVDSLPASSHAEDLYTVSELTSERPARRLGVLAYRRYPRENRVATPPFGDVDSHVALMRAPRLVVKYLRVGSDAEAFATAGVFVADAELDEKFALSEPVTHDDWIPQRAQGEQYERNPVRQALDRIRRSFRARPVPPVVGESGHLPGVTSLATMLGGLLAGMPGGVDPGIPAGTASGVPAGPAGGDGGVGGGGAPQRPRSQAVARIGENASLLVTESGEAAVEFDVYAIAPDGATLRVHALPRVVLEGAALEALEEAPAGAPVPRVIGWRARNTSDLVAGDVLTITDRSEREWVVRMSQPPDTAVTLTLRLEATAG